MSDTALRKVPPLPPGVDEEDCWFCYEYRASNEDFISPWFDDEFAVFDYLEAVDEYLITRKYIRTSDGVREDDGTGELLDLPVHDLSLLSEPTAAKSWEDEVES